ncbi:MAG: hypothetical protein WCV80_01760 [Candidatus Paceibacterota bacterium]|jgi:hypothetical protein
MRSIIIVIGIILATLSLIYGAYKPLVKASSYIGALGKVQTARSVGEFKTIFDTPVFFNSPVGDEEVIKFLSNDISEIIFQENMSEEASRALVDYLEPHLFANSVIHLLNGSRLHSILWQKFGHSEDFVIAENYLKKAKRIGPQLPPVLYGFLGLYSAKGDEENIQKISEEILKYWPNDEKVKSLLQK